MNELLAAIKTSNQLRNKLLKQKNKVDEAVQLIFKTLKSNNKILICGNGGSAADAQHLAAEFLIQLTSKVKRKSYPVIPLALDSSTLTACGNDLGFDSIFSRPFEGIVRKGDLLIVLSTSGNSKNILKVLNTARKLNIKSLSFLGNNGGKSKGKANLEIIVPSTNTARIQECHIFLGHLIFSLVEKKLIK